LLTCANEKFWFSSHVNTNKSVFYIVNSFDNSKADTMLLSHLGSLGRQCFCTDSTVVFYSESYNPLIFYFKIIDNKWKYVHYYSLPTLFPMIGTLERGEIYEHYKHTLVSTDRVISELTVLKANDEEDQLIPIEKYDIEYRIDPSINELIIDKKTLKDE
jgi:hypothetical protein